MVSTGIKNEGFKRMRRMERMLEQLQLREHCSDKSNGIFLGSAASSLSWRVP
jgi:hypothetical protein